MFEAAKALSPHFVVEKNTITVQRTRAPEIVKGARLSAQFLAWAEANNIVISDARRPRLIEKLDSLEAPA